MQRLGLPGTARASLGLYNNSDDIDRLSAALEKARQIFG
jgi:cysteine desulfurase/selenocysteine lyase